MCTSMGGGGEPFSVRSEVDTRTAAAMLAIGLLDDGSVTTRQRCVGCVRNWWKNTRRRVQTASARPVERGVAH